MGIAYYFSSDGQVHYLAQGSFHQVAIADTGLYLFNTFPSTAYIGFGTYFVPLMDFADMAALNGQYAFHCPSTSIPGCPAGYASSVSGIFGLAINDSNQLLVDLELGAGPDLQIKGILSPFAVPEPSALLLLATAVCLGVLKLARRRYSI